jgi:hypothetical protein
MTTDFSNKVEILGEFYFLHRDDKNIKEFIDFNDLGLPLAYLAREGLCDISDDGKKYVAETWELFLSTLGILQDEGFDSLDVVMAQASIGKWPGDQ